MSDIKELFDQILAEPGPPMADSRDIVRAAKRVRRRRIGGITGGAAAVTAAAVAVSMAAAGPAPSGSLSGATSSGAPASASTVFLTSARNAAKTTLATGRYWHTEVRTRQEIVDLPTSGKPKPGTGKAKPSKIRLLPDAIFDTTTQRQWQGLDGTVHVVDGLDPVISFATPADKAAWKAAGSPTDLFTPRRTYTEKLPANPPGKRGSLAVDLSLRNAPKLPADPARLRAVLKVAYHADPSGEPDFASFVYSSATDILTSPTTPATRAALYRILATLPGVHVLGTVRDSLGRTGVAVARAEADGPNSPGLRILIIDPDSGRLLANELKPTAGKDKGRVIFAETFAVATWANQIGG